MVLLVTGGCGFIGSNFVRYFHDTHPDHKIINLDKLTYAGNPANLADLESLPFYVFVRGDICDRETVDTILREHRVEAIINFAAETHVDRSITGPAVFMKTNVGGTNVLLDAAREHGVDRFVQVSTDEVYGSLGPEGAFTEETPLHPNSPYAASKAAGDLLVQAYHHTYGLPAMITRCSNNYGPYQFPEKLIPLMISSALAGKSLPVYGDGLNVRDWIHVTDHCRALDAMLLKGLGGEVYNVGGGNEWRNIDIVKFILKELGRPEDLIRFIEDRPGHDRRYAIDHSKISTHTGWKPLINFTEGLGKTIRWYVDHAEWWRPLSAGSAAC
ncbi:MAG TPA: dTDP-glucose 4,6-dehydratase [Bacteroidota bacterium]|nr:dTDP-glucose 4,6-dehydratase [Bacteroidota bacterium]